MLEKNRAKGAARLRFFVVQNGVRHFTYTGMLCEVGGVSRCTFAIRVFHECFHIGDSIIINPAICIAFQFSDNCLERAPSLSFGNLTRFLLESLFAFPVWTYTIL
jgi:hypothetical protein